MYRGVVFAHSARRGFWPIVVNAALMPTGNGKKNSVFKNVSILLSYLKERNVFGAGRILHQKNSVVISVTSHEEAVHGWVS